MRVIAALRRIGRKFEPPGNREPLEDSVRQQHMDTGGRTGSGTPTYSNDFKRVG